MLGDLYPQLLGLELVGEICSSFYVVEPDLVDVDKSIFVFRCPPATGVSQEAVEHYVAPLFFTILRTLLETTTAGVHAVGDNDHVVYFCDGVSWISPLNKNSLPLSGLRW